MCSLPATDPGHVLATLRAVPVRRLALYVPAAAALLALLVFEAVQTHYLPTTVATVLTGALCIAAVLVPPRRFPVLACIAVTASLLLTGVSTALAHRPETTPGMAESGALLLVVTRSVRQLTWPRAVGLALLAGFAAGALLLRIDSGQWSDVGNYVAPLLMFAELVAVGLGLYLRQHDTLRARLRAAELQDQRLEYARELHDFVAHHVTAIVTQAKAVRYATAGGHAPAAADLDRMLALIEESGSEAMTSMRSMVSVLRAPSGAGTGPGGSLAALRPLVADFARHGPPCELTLDPRLADRALAPQITTGVHRLVQESLTNVRKHGVSVSKVVVDVRLSPERADLIEAVVTDDGRGPRGAGRGEGFGLVGLAERIAAAGGTFAAGRGPGGGWRVEAGLPVPDLRRGAPHGRSATTSPSGIFRGSPHGPSATAGPSGTVSPPGTVSPSGV
ncbi:hypothetical protein DY218_10240 [Streptomyces triticagri]|uniref:histidine kinase n=2 Tax=Streptomyces triticagri TaxID=2293568 RepID=A0A372M8U0_9ACTN|nr:hypothetical protein DY218_10240 [Streptomyces triticagri]